MRADKQLLAGVLILVLWLVSGAEVLRVPQDYAAIQAALDAVHSDDTVLVALGTYAEELQAPPLRFWLIGDVVPDTGDFPRPVINPSTLDSAQWRHCLAIPEGTELTVEKMKFVNRAAMYPRPDAFVSGGIIVNTVQRTTFRYCAFDSVYRAIVHDSPAGMAIKINAEDCMFTHAPRIQIRAMDGQVIARRCSFHARHCVSDVIIGGDSSLVEQCVFTGDSLNNFVLLQGTDLAIRDCVFGPADSCGAALGMRNDGSGVIERNLVHDVQFGGGVGGSNLITGDVPVLWRHNSFVQNRAYGNGSTGIFLGHQTEPASEYSAVLDTNLFQDCVQGSGAGNGKALTLETQVSATSNHFVGLEPDGLASIVAVSVNDVSRLRYNQFQAQDYAVHCLARGLDAIVNYWGDASGPFNAAHNPSGLGARVDDSVFFDPWCPDTNCFLSVPGIGKPLPKEFVFEAYPNPFNSTLHLTLIPSEIGIVKVELFDLLGRRVEEIWHGPLAFQKDITFDASALASGIYFAKVTDVIDRKSLAMAKLVMLK